MQQETAAVSLGYEEWGRLLGKLAKASATDLLIELCRQLPNEIEYAFLFPEEEDYVEF